MKLWKKIVIGFLGLILLSIGGSYFLIQSLPDLCGNQVIAEYPSPNNKLRAVAFQRDCGATTGFSTQVSILPGANALENEGGNIFSGATPTGQVSSSAVEINWLSDTRLQLRHHHSVRIFHAESDSHGVKVEYQTF